MACRKYCLSVTSGDAVPGTRVARACPSIPRSRTDTHSTGRWATSRKDHPWQPSNSRTPTTPGRSSSPGPASSPGPSAAPSGRAAATPSSTRAGAARPSPRTASPSPRTSSSKDPFENMGAQLVKEAASKTSRRRRRRHHHRDRPRRVHLPRRAAGRRRRARPDGARPRHPEGRRPGRRRTAQARRGDRPEGHQEHHRGRHASRPTTTRRSARSSPRR